MGGDLRSKIKAIVGVYTRDDETRSYGKGRHI